MGRSLHTVFTLVSKASFSLNKMGLDFLVYRAIVGLFCLVVRIVVGKNQENHLHSFTGKPILRIVSPIAYSNTPYSLPYSLYLPH